MESRIIPRLTEISHQEALRYLGIRGDPSGTLPEEQDLSRCETVLRGAVRAVAVPASRRRRADGHARHGAGAARVPARVGMQLAISGAHRAVSRNDRRRRRIGARQTV